MISRKRLIQLQLFFALLSSVIIIVITCLTYSSGLLNNGGLLLYDLHFKLRSNYYHSDSIVLVSMDSRSAEILGRQKGGWSRSQMAKALDNLCEAGAEVIGLDLVYDLPGKEPGVDQALAQSINDCNNVVLASVVSASSGADRVPLSIFQEAMIGDGFINFILDEDEVLRKLRFFNSRTLNDGSMELLPSFALELVRTYLDIDYVLDFTDKKSFRLGPADGRHLILPNPELLINYQGDYSVFDSLSYADVVLGRFSPDQVKGKLIIVGTSHNNDKDRFSTPITKSLRNSENYEGKFGHIVRGTSGPKEHGAVCHAHGVETILSGQFLTLVQVRYQILLIILVGIVGFLFYLPEISMLFEGLLIFGGLAVLFLSSYLFFRYQLLWLDYAPFIVVFFLQFVAGIMVQKVFNKKRSEMVTSIFGKYVSKDVVGELVAGNIDLSLDGRRQELTILFSDLRDFTSISESLGAKKTSRLLNNYFEIMIPHVFQYRGTLDKLIGDALMAFYGAPLAVPNHQEKAARTALAMMDSFEKMREDAENEDGWLLKMGIGINSGEVTVGNLGSSGHVEYTVIGDAVNLASRLEGLTKVYGVNILLSEFTAAELGDEFYMRELDRVRVKGKSKSIVLYELLGFRDQLSEEDKLLVQRFELGLQAYRKQKWGRAESAFMKVLRINHNDIPAKLYLQRIDDFRDTAPGADWDGVTIFDHK